MPDSAVIPATTTYRMTSLAWALAVHSATETLRGEAGLDPSFHRPGRRLLSWQGWTKRPSGALAACRNDPSTQAFITSEPGEVRSTTSGIGREE